jgi:hypothetical protein
LCVRRRFGAAHVSSAHAQLSVTFEGRIDAAALAAGLAQLDLVRAKGFVCDQDGQWQTIQLAGRRTTLEPAPAHISGPARLVLIAQGDDAIDHEAAMALFTRCGAKALR